MAIAVLAFFQWQTMKAHKKSLEDMATNMERGLAETKKAAEAAGVSAEAAKQSFVLSHRPKLSIRFMRPTAWHYEPLMPTAGTCEVFNTGDTKAVLEQEWFEIVVGQNLPATAPYRGKNGKALTDEIILPGKSHEVIFPSYESAKFDYDDPEQFSAIKREEMFVFVVGWISYVDEAKQHRTAGFCHRFNPKIQRFDRVRDADYEYGDHG